MTVRILKKLIMKKFFEQIETKDFMKVNYVLTGLFLVLLAGKIYMNAYSNDPGCPEGPIPDCPPYGTAFFPHPGDCSWFFHCVDGVAYCKQCPADLHWNKMLDTCDFPYRAGCLSWEDFEKNYCEPARPTDVCVGLIVTPNGNSGIDIPGSRNKIPGK